MKFKQKFCANHKYNNGRAGQDRRILYTVTAIMICMNAIVAVNSATAAAATLTTAESAATATSTTMAKTLPNNTSRNPIIAQQSSKTSPPHMPPPTAMSASSATSTDTTTTSSAIQNTKTNTDIFSYGVAGSITGNDPRPPSPIAENMGNCKSLTDTWGDVDPNIYYLCDTHTQQPLALRCPEGRGYFNGFGYAGCIPYDDWPACRPLHAHEQVHICDSDHMQQPWETMNPNKFYICLQEAIEPMLLNCGQGKGFLHVVVDASSNDRGVGAGSSEVVGCANWEKWRSYMQCTDYY